MLIRLPVPGGWYGENLVTGEYAVSLFDQYAVMTHAGRVDIARDLLYTRCATNPFRFAGQDHFGTQNYEVTAGVGRDVGPSFGVNPVIYRDGVLVQASQSHQGYRFVSDSGVLVTGDESMFDSLNNVHEFTDTGGFRVGQGHDSGCHVVCPDGAVRVLEQGHCTFVRVNRLNDNFAITVVKQLERQTILFWLDKSDILQLPIYRPAVGSPVNPPQPPAKPIPQPPPVEKPKETMKNKDQVRADIDELIRFYNDPDGLNRAARGIPSPVTFNDPAITDWFTLAVMLPVEEVKRRIRSFPEYKEQHPSDLSEVP